MNPHDLSWQDHAACRTEPNRKFFPKKIPTKHEVRRIKETLARIAHRRTLAPSDLTPTQWDRLDKLHRDQLDVFTSARIICAHCPVRQPCLEYALEHIPNDSACGLWGGLDGIERRQLKRRRKEDAAALMERLAG